MQKRSFLILFGATLILAAGAVYAVKRGDRFVGPPIKGGLALPHLAADLKNLAWMRLTRGAMVSDFTAIGSGWVVVEKSNYPAAPNKVRRLLLGLADLTLVEPKTRRPELLGRLNLDDPKNGKSTLVTLQDRTGKTVAELIVGKSRPDLLGGGNNGVYVRKPGENQAWLARGSLDVSGDTIGWLDRRFLDIAPSRVASLTLTGADGTMLVLRRDGPKGKFAVVGAPADTKFKDDATLAAPAGALSGLDLDDVKPAVDLPVPESGVAHAVFTTADGLTIKLLLFNHDKVDWVAVEASGDGTEAADARAINARVARWIYAIPSDRAKLLRTKLSDLIAPPKGS